VQATCWDDDKAKQRAETEIIEFPTVLYRVVVSDGGDTDSSLVKAGEWRSFVRPVVNPLLSAFCTQLTGITQAQADAAEPLADVLGAHAAWLASATEGAPPQDVLFVTCGHWDLGTCLPLELRNKPGLRLPSPIYHRWTSVTDAFASAWGVRSASLSMPDMLSLAGLSLEGHHHSGLDDSRNIGRILEAVWQRGKRVFAVRSSQPGAAATGS
jgi:inhibitor of KinA sporulation pathway (predicted exonuclease)